jgi:glycosyltransferase involved in cell wall biosynthesis
MEVDVKPPVVSIIMPAYNVEDAVKMVEQAMANIAEDYEVIVVNDGSEDGTRRVLEELMDSRVKIADHRINLGKGAAIKTGVEYVKGECAIILDADGDISHIDVRNVRRYIVGDTQMGFKAFKTKHLKMIMKAIVVRRLGC